MYVHHVLVLCHPQPPRRPWSQMASLLRVMNTTTATGRKLVSRSKMAQIYHGHQPTDEAMRQTWSTPFERVEEREGGRKRRSEEHLCGKRDYTVRVYVVRTYEYIRCNVLYTVRESKTERMEEERVLNQLIPREPFAPCSTKNLRATHYVVCTSTWNFSQHGFSKDFSVCQQLLELVFNLVKNLNFPFPPPTSTRLFSSSRKTNLDESPLLLPLWIQALRRTKKSNWGEITLNQPQDEQKYYLDAFSSPKQVVSLLSATIMTN